MSDRIFITGGASGPGRESALGFARARWRVRVGDVNGQARRMLARGAGSAAGRGGG